MKEETLSEQGITLKALNEILPKEDKSNIFYHNSKVKEAVLKLENKKQEIANKIMNLEITGEEGFIEYCDFSDEIFGEELSK